MRGGTASHMFTTPMGNPGNDRPVLDFVYHNDRNAVVGIHDFCMFVIYFCVIKFTVY